VGDVPASGKARFAHNTVVDNRHVGIACKIPFDITSNIVHGNAVANGVNCGASACCGTGSPDPMLTSSYRLAVGSPCIDKIDATSMSPAVDIDGQPRPHNVRLDCGADEYRP
jgi:hypothetical protein